MPLPTSAQDLWELSDWPFCQAGLGTCKLDLDGVWDVITQAMGVRVSPVGEEHQDKHRSMGKKNISENNRRSVQ